MRRLFSIGIIGLVLVGLIIVAFKHYISKNIDSVQPREVIKSPDKPFSQRAIISANRKSLQLRLIVGNITISQTYGYFIIEGSEKTTSLLTFTVELGPKDYYILQRNSNPEKYGNILEKSYKVSKIINDIVLGETIELELGFTTPEELNSFLINADEYEKNAGKSSQATLVIPYSNILSIMML